jgi:hypothetical protein
MKSEASIEAEQFADKLFDEALDRPEGADYPAATHCGPFPGPGLTGFGIGRPSATPARKKTPRR